MNLPWRPAASRPAFTIVEIVISLAILSTLALSAALMITPQISYFRTRSDARNLLAGLRDQQAQAARAGFTDGGARGGGLIFFHGHVVSNSADGSWTTKDEAEPNVFSYVPCPIDTVTDPARPRVKFPGPGGNARSLTDLSQAERASVINVAEGSLLRNSLTGAPVQSGDFIVFAEKDLSATDGGLGTKPLDRGAAIFSAGFGTSQELVVDGADSRFTLTLDPGGFISAVKR